jgi:cbb3-type cytochrome oxidase subunit 1
VSLPLRFILSGVGALLIGAGWLALRPEVLATYHYNQYVIALTHLIALGWLGSVVMGTAYQLVPVALETRLHSERLARWHFALHLLGVAGMVWMFWIWNMKQVGHFGCLFGAGVVLFVYDLGRTLARVPRWNVVAGGIAASLAWLSLTLLAGLYLVSAKCWPQISPFHPIAAMHAHAHLGVLGFFLMLIVGVSYKLVPMFTLSQMQSRRRAWWSLLLLNAGLLGLSVAILLGHRVKLLFAIVAIAGFVVYGVELRAILSARKRAALDWGLKHFLTAVSLLAPLSALAIVLCWPGLPTTAFTAQLENVYGFLAIFGVVTFAIVGMLYKIVPFLVWYASYSRHIGRSKVPSLAELYSPRWQATGYWSFMAALLAGAVSTALGSETAVQWSCSFFLASLAAFAVNLTKMLSHLVSPRLEPLPLRPASEAPV